MSLALALSRVKHLSDGVDSNGREAICDRTVGKLLDGFLHFGDPNIVVFHPGVDVTIFVEHLVDGDDAPITVIMTTRTSMVRFVRCVAVGTMRT